jgi:hypothetical protein
MKTMMEMYRCYEVQFYFFLEIVHKVFAEKLVQTIWVSGGVVGQMLKSTTC